MLQRPLDNGPPVVTVVDFSQAITDASAMELDADREAQLDFFLSVVCPCCPAQQLGSDTALQCAGKCRNAGENWAHCHPPHDLCAGVRAARCS